MCEKLVCSSSLESTKKNWSQCRSYTMNNPKQSAPSSPCFMSVCPGAVELFQFWPHWWADWLKTLLTDICIPITVQLVTMPTTNCFSWILAHFKAESFICLVERMKKVKKAQAEVWKSWLSGSLLHNGFRFGGCVKTGWRSAQACVWIRISRVLKNRAECTALSSWYARMMCECCWGLSE